jgi:hypothetical protein
MLRTSIGPVSGVASEQRRDVALSAAIALRDCSLREQATNEERRACRTLMREAAIGWRRSTRAIPPG